jgi:glycosyltransferase involved in cell wall biosynthesis
MPQISIITPFYNREKIISYTIESVLRQTFDDWELILVDDGSDDNTESLIKAFVDKEPRIKYLKREAEPKGPCTCRNIGAKSASGEFLIFLDSDDLLAPFCLAQRLAVMRNHSELDFAVFNIELMKDIPGDTGVFFNKVPGKGENYIDLFLRMDTPWQTSCPIWRKEYFLRAGGFNEQFLIKTDPELHTRVLINFAPHYKVMDDLPADCYYRFQYGDANKNTGYSKNAIIYRMKFIKSCTRWVEKIPGNSIISRQMKRQIRIGVLNFYKHMFISSARLYNDEYHSFIDWALTKKLIFPYEYRILQSIGKLKMSSNPVLKKLRLVGLLYHLLLVPKK